MNHLLNRVQRHPRIVLGLIAMLGAIWIIMGSQGSGRPAAQSTGPLSSQIAPRVGAQAPDFDLLTPDGSHIRLRDLRGKAVLINFWATWCSPCRAEMPTMQAMYDRYAAQGFTIVGVNMREPASALPPFMRELGLTFPIVIDDGSTARAYNVINIPASFFIDADGIIRALYFGPMSRSVMDASLDAVLPKTP